MTNKETNAIMTFLSFSKYFLIITVFWNYCVWN